MAKIRTHDPSIYHMEKPVFEELDFEREDMLQETHKSSQKKFTYKEMMQQQAS